MDPMLLFLLLASFFTNTLSLEAEPAKPTSQITVMGVVYCDICSNNTFSRNSYFLPGAEVHIECKFKAESPRTTEQISFSVNRTTDKFGVYRLEIPSVDGVDCAEDPVIQSFCRASLVGSSCSSCNVPGLKTTSDQITIKAKQANLCIYSLNALNYRPPKRNTTLCGIYKEDLSSSFNSSKFFLPYFPPYGFPLPPLPPFPTLPPFPSLPFPPLPPFSLFPFPPLPPFPSFPFPPKPPSLPFPFPPLPPFPPTPTFFPSPPPPSFPFPFPFPPLPPFLPTPLFFPSPPPPPTFNLGDPRTWIPFIPPSPPNHPQNQHP